MATINARRVSFFTMKAHDRVDVFYYTSDDQAFRTKGDASNQAQKLAAKGKDATVDMITRAMADKWLTDNGELPAPAVDGADITNAQAEVDAANKQLATDANALAVAQEALDAAKATNDAGQIETAQKGLDAATAALDADKAKVSTDKQMLTAAQKRAITMAGNKVAAAQKILAEAQSSGAGAEDIAPLQTAVDVAQATLNAIVNG